MKKVLLIVFLLLAVALIFFILQGDFSGISPSPSAVPSASPAPMSEPSAPPEIEEPTRTPDPRNEEPVIRAEIANLIRDVKELLSEGLTDDASMVIRDLRTRDLTEAEKSQVDALQAELSGISENKSN